MVFEMDFKCSTIDLVIIVYFVDYGKR